MAYRGAKLPFHRIRITCSSKRSLPEVRRTNFFRYIGIPNRSEGSGTNYPGRGTAYDLISNTWKYYGGTEHDIKWGVTWRNLLMYNSIGPEVDKSGSSGGSNNPTMGANEAVSLWDIGKRLDQGLGV